MIKAVSPALFAFAVVQSVHAQTLDVAVKFSADGGATWSSNLLASGGSIIQGAIFMSGTGAIYGLGGATLRLTATGAQGDFAQFGAGTDTGRVGPFNFGAATNAIYNTAGGFRIDAASDPGNANTAAGMTFFQRDPSSGGAGFSTANPALVFRFDIVAMGSSERFITVSLDELSNGVATYYSSSSATRSTRLSATLTSGTLGLGIPTPSSLAMLAIGGFSLARRRRA